MGLREEGRTIFLSTNNLEEAELLCDRIAVARNRLVAIDTAKNLRNRLFQRQVIVELEEVDQKVISAVMSLSFVSNVERNEIQLIVGFRDFDKNRSELVRCIVEQGGNITSVFEKKHSLEEIYLTLIKEEQEIKI